MVIVQINATYGRGSTGKICMEISRLLTKNNVENYVLHSQETSGETVAIQCSDARYIRLQALKSKVFGNYGFNSREATKQIIDNLQRIQPDVVHLHNIHGHDCHLENLLNYLAQKKIRVFWTFHDCWAFTGYCTHFLMESCEKWKTGCHDCPRVRQYSWFFDRSKELFHKKKELLSKLDLTVITPSKWLADLVKESFLVDCPIKVIHNGIDLTVFRPDPGDFRQRYGISPEKIVLLGVSYIWDRRKGLDVFEHLARELDPQRYQIVLVGTDPEMDKKLPKQIISIHRTQNQQELAQIYASADVFLNPTREDNFPTVNMEALACGTPVITFSTGGSPEALDKSCGSVVEYNNIDQFCDEVRRVCETRPYSREDCIKRGQQFDCNRFFQQYVELYGGIVCERTSKNGI